MSRHVGDLIAVGLLALALIAGAKKIGKMK